MVTEGDNNFHVKTIEDNDVDKEDTDSEEDINAEENLPPLVDNLEPGVIPAPDMIGTTLLDTPRTPIDSPNFDDSKEVDNFDKETPAIDCLRDQRR